MTNNLAQWVECPMRPLTAALIVAWTSIRSPLTEHSMHSTKYAHCLRTGAAVSLATALSWIVLSQAHSGENPPAPFTASVQFAGPQPRFVVSWHAPADAQHFNVLIEDGNGNVAMLRNALTTSSAEFEFDVGLATDW